MEIKGVVHCLFEQSGVFKNEFKKLGYDASDWDIQNNFAQTDHVIDLFAEIENAYDDKPSIFDEMTCDDLLMAFFPCIYFCQTSTAMFSYNDINYRYCTGKQIISNILERCEKRNIYYELLIKLFGVVLERDLRMIVENPWSGQTYLKGNFLFRPTFVDKNRTLRGDYYVKPTAYWFVGCDPTNGNSLQFFPNRVKRQNDAKSRWIRNAGVCNEERSLISPDYARNFICDFILGKKQDYSQLTLFDENKE